MIGSFPDPYPDELLYSVCARYHRRTKYKSKTHTTTDLFGEEACAISLFLPRHIGHLVSQLPPSHQYSADRLIDENTLLPFFGPFLPPQRLKLLRECMRQGFLGISTYQCAGISPGQTITAYLRFCQMCAKEDLKLYGEPYWHRLHQVPGVAVCIRHLTILEDSKVGARWSRGNRETFITAKQAIADTSSSFLLLSNPRHKIYSQLACDVFWLLSQRRLSIPTNYLRSCYRCILHNRGMIHHQGRGRLISFRNKVEEYFTKELLASFKCRLEGNNHWLYRLVRPVGYIQHPLNHLLLINFLGYTMQDFCTLLQTSQFTNQALSPAPSKHTEEKIMGNSGTHQ